ncbi:MAG: hypothetical protein JST04_13465 [Bdellovibrionales bacterium]|nr:hypothetical protein [Bdellovibrionales bacterium]
MSKYRKIREIAIWTLTALSCVVGTGALSSARADDCSPIRLDEAGKDLYGRPVEGTMMHVEVRDQHQIGSCYAQASAQMYDAWRFRHGENSPSDYANFSSGFEVGQRFKTDENDTDINGGFIKELLPYLLDQGTCSEAQLNDLFEPKYRVDPRYRLDVNTYASEIMRRFNRYRDEFHKERDAIYAKYFPKEKRPTPSFWAANPVLAPMLFVTLHYLPIGQVDETTRKANAEIAAARDRYLKAGADELSSTHRDILRDHDFYRHIKYGSLVTEAKSWTANEVNTVKMFDLIGVIKCDDKDRLRTRGRFEVVTKSTYEKSKDLFGIPSKYRGDKMRAILDGELNKGLGAAYPIGINYCSSVFGEGRAFTQKKWINNDECHRHASLVIGRRRDPKAPSRCQYLIRNSWGRGCDSSYHSDWECDGPKGSVWIDADALGRATHDLALMRTIYD